MTPTSVKSPIPALQFAARLRLNDDQRDQLKRAFNLALNEAASPVSGKGIAVVTHRASTIEAELGMDRMTFSSLVGSRESHPIPLLLRLQRVLGVELVTEKYLNDSFKSYVDHLKREYW